MQAAAWEKYSPMPLLSCHLLICQNRENRLGQDAIVYTNSSGMSTLDAMPFIADIMILSYNVDLFICKNQLFEFE